MAKGETLDDLLKQRAEIDEKIKAMAEEERASLMAKLAALDEVAPQATVRRNRTTGQRAAPRVKYRGPNGEEWSGRGRPAAWLAELEAGGRSREEFLVD